MRYAELEPTIRAAIEHYAEDVRSGAYPTADHSFALPKSVSEALDRDGAPVE